MIQLLINRNRFYDTHTIGQLYVNGEFFCFTLEDVVRERPGLSVKDWKIKGESAIPVGIYDVTLENSPRFGPQTLTIHRVPGFTGVRIHAGNTHLDTEGCILLGYKFTDNGIQNSRAAVNDLRRLIANAGGRAILRLTGLPPLVNTNHVPNDGKSR